MVGCKVPCPGFKTSSLKWDRISFVQMNQHSNLTPREEANCRRYKNLSYAHELVEKMEPKTKVSPLPPFVGASSSSWRAAPWGFSAKQRAKARLYRPTYPWQLCSNRGNRFLRSLQHWNLSRGWRIYLEWIQRWSRTLGWSLSLLAHLFPICCFLPWLFGLTARAVASLPAGRVTSVFLFADFWMQVLCMAVLI